MSELEVRGKGRVTEGNVQVVLDCQGATVTIDVPKDTPEEAVNLLLSNAPYLSDQVLERLLDAAEDGGGDEAGEG